MLTSATGSSARRRPLAFLTFRSLLGFPIDLLLGRLSAPEVGAGLLIQLGWAAALFGLMRLLWARGVRRDSAVGA